MSDDYILFEHQLTAADLKGSYRSLFCSFGLLLCCFFLLFFLPKTSFSNEILLVNINIFAVLSFIFVIVSAVFVWMGTKSKVILTDDGIYYKPPISKRIYEMKFVDIIAFEYKQSLLIVSGKKQKQFAVYLTENTALAIMNILKEKTPARNG